MKVKEKEREALKLRIGWKHGEFFTVPSPKSSPISSPSTSSFGRLVEPPSTTTTTTTSSSFEPPQSKKPRRIAHVPKEHTPHNRPLTPCSKSPSAERSPFNGTGSNTNSPAFSLSGILTPTSISPSPSEENETDPIDQMIATIVNWDAEKIMDKRYINQRFHENVAVVPSTTFENFEIYKQLV